MTPQPSEQPRTAAGRALVDMPLHTAGIGSDRDDDRLRKAVLAIELQAALPPEVFSRFVRRLELELAAPDPVASPCTTCRHPYSEHTGRGLQAGRLSPEEARMGGGCEHGEDFHHTCSCSRYVEGAVASPAPLDAYDMRIMVRALYTSGLTDEMNPSDRRKAALRLRATLQEQSARLEGQPAGEEPS